MKKTFLLLGCVIAALFITGCSGPKFKTASQSPALTSEQYAALTQNQRSQQQDMAGRSIYSSLDLQVNPDPEQRGVSSLKQDVSMGSNMDVTGLDSGAIDLHSSQPVSVNKDELYQLPVGVSVKIGAYASADAKRAADEKDAMARLAAARAAGAEAIVTASYKGQALTIDAEGKARVAVINAKTNQIVSITKTLADGTKQVIDGAIQFFPPAAAVGAAKDVLTSVVVKDDNGNYHEGTLTDTPANPIPE